LLLNLIHPQISLIRFFKELEPFIPKHVPKYELLYDPVIGGKTETIRKSLQRLEKRGLIKYIDEDKDGKKYQAILARGDSMNSVPPILNDSSGTEFGSGHTHGTPQDCPTPIDDGTLSV